MNKFPIFLPLILLALVSACNKEDTKAPVITLNQPENGSTYINAQRLNINMNVRDETMIQEVHLIFRNLNNGEVYLESHTSIDNKSYDLHHQFTVSATSRDTCEMKVDCNDKAGNISSQKITVYLAP